MSVINNSLLATPEGYQISRSVRLRSSASAYFNRTFGTPTDLKKQTFSAWVKRGTLGVAQAIIGASDGSANQARLEFLAGDTLNLRFGGSAVNNTTTTAVFRDPSAWYHIMFVIDTTQSTSTNRVLLYVNNVLQTVTATAPALNASSQFAYAGANNKVGVSGLSGTDYFDGYLTEVNFIDGQALTPSSFGETDGATGVWKPKKYLGTYGTNGFYLNFSDNSNNTAATIGKDYSGNGNNWTPNNISVTAGATYDSMLDVPTNLDDGVTGRGNYAVLNPVSGTVVSLTNANLQATYASTWQTVPATMAIPSSGKWYWEVLATAIGTPAAQIGIATVATPLGTYFGVYSTGYAYQSNTGNKMTNNVATAYGATYATNDVVGVAFDSDTLALTFYKNGVSQGAAYTVSAGEYIPVIALNGATAGVAANFGQRPFAYTPPTGFKALNTQNLPDATIKKGNQYFDILTWSGDSTNNRSITGLNFSPDFAWVKSRSYAGQSHHFVDNVRGVGTGIMRTLYSNQTVAEETTTSAATLTFGGIKSLDANGITTVAGTNGANPYAQTNQSPQTYVGWHWNAGGSTVTNTSGTISAQVRANATAGFSVVTYTGTGANATVGHGLGVAPKMIMVKTRSAVDGWGVYHASLTNTQALLLESTAAVATSATYWNSTSPTSSVFSVGTWSRSNASAATYVAYCFAEVAGYSKFGSYTGNGSADGSFVYLGFRPRWVMFKRTDTTSNWLIIDSVRGSYNADKNRLFPNLSNAEDTSENFDFLSNGFKLRDSAGSMNASGGTYIFAAFAENPFKHSLAR